MPADHIYPLWSLLWARKTFSQLSPDKKKLFPVEKRCLGRCSTALRAQTVPAGAARLRMMCFHARRPHLSLVKLTMGEKNLFKAISGQEKAFPGREKMLGKMQHGALGTNGACSGQGGVWARR